MRGGTSFADAARTAGFTAADINVANQSQAQFAGTTGPEVARAAFAAAQGAVVGPVRSGLGFHIVRTERINQTPAQSLEFGPSRDRPGDRDAQARRRPERPDRARRTEGRRRRQRRGSGTGRAPEPRHDASDHGGRPGARPGLCPPARIAAGTAQRLRARPGRSRAGGRAAAQQQFRPGRDRARHPRRGAAAGPDSGPGP